jgi:hypothetical protein
MKKIKVFLVLICVLTLQLTLVTPARANGCVVGPGAILENCDLSGQDLSGANLTGANLTRAKLNGTNLTGATIVEANFSYVDFRTTTFDLIEGYGANFSFANFTGMKINGNLYFANLTGANLTGADISWINLSFSNLTDANLTGANLIRTNLRSSDLTGANLTGAQLGANDLEGTNLLRVVFDPIMSFSISGKPKNIPSDYYLGTSPSRIANKFNQSPAPIISGISRVGEKLTASIGVWDPGTKNTTSWIVGTASIPGPPLKLDFVVEASQVGSIICFEVGGTKEGIRVGNTIRSFGVTRKTCLPPVAKGVIPPQVPKFTGVVKVKQSLKWKPTSALVVGGKFTFQWLLDGKPIKGATKSSFILLPTQKGKKISLRVSQEAPGYVTASATTASVKVG